MASGAHRRVLVDVGLTLTAACSFVPGDPNASVTDDGGDSDAASEPTDAPAIDGAALDDGAATDAAASDAPSPPTDGPSACPTGFFGYDTVHGTSRYGLRPIAQPYGIALIDCADDLPGRTHLATFEIPDDLQPVLVHLAPGKNATVFVGASCVSFGVTNCAMPSAWTWTGGGGVEPSLWRTGQPDNPLIETVGVVRREGGWLLENEAAALTRPYICECDP